MMVASPRCAERPASAPLIGRLAERHAGILWRREKSPLGRQRTPSRAERFR